MLDALDDIDWESLRHAYGSAKNVPQLLRALASNDQDKRQDAISKLFETIWHQGTVYTATAAAVPFLYELLNGPTVSDKPAIAGLLGCIASGNGYLEAHATTKFGERTWRTILQREGKTLESELEREAVDILGVQRAVSARLLDLIAYLGDPEPENRRAIAEAFGCYPDFATTTLPALRAAAASETDEEVAETIDASITRLANA